MLSDPLQAFIRINFDENIYELKLFYSNGFGKKSHNVQTEFGLMRSIFFNGALGYRYDFERDEHDGRIFLGGGFFNFAQLQIGYSLRDNFLWRLNFSYPVGQVNAACFFENNFHYSRIGFGVIYPFE